MTADDQNDEKAYNYSHFGSLVWGILDITWHISNNTNDVYISADSCVNPCDWSVHFDFLMFLGHLGSKEHHLIGCEFGRPFNPILGG